MVAKQLSVFIENRQGRLGEVLKVLKDNDVNILSLSLADTTEYGLLRLIVTNPETGKEALAKSGFSTLLSDVLIVKIAHEAGSLQKLLEILTAKEVNIEYMYGLSTEDTQATIVLKANDVIAVEKILTESNVKTLSVDEII